LKPANLSGYKNPWMNHDHPARALPSARYHWHPFTKRRYAFAVGAVLAFLRAVLFLPARLLGYRRSCNCRA
jgi:hypothetical protein